MRANLVLNFYDLDFWCARPFQRQRKIARPNAPPRIVAELYKKTFIVFCDQHQRMRDWGAMKVNRTRSKTTLDFQCAAKGFQLREIAAIQTPVSWRLRYI